MYRPLIFPVILFCTSFVHLHVYHQCLEFYESYQSSFTKDIVAFARYLYQTFIWRCPLLLRVVKYNEVIIWRHSDHLHLMHHPISVYVKFGKKEQYRWYFMVCILRSSFAWNCQNAAALTYPWIKTHVFDRHTRYFSFKKLHI